ncbi:MAG: hypothetical protein ACRDZ1_00265 [Acidimicrobiia bacterium]
MAPGESSGSTLGWPGRVSVAVLRSDPPVVLLAENDAVIGRLLALRLVARSRPRELESSGLLDDIRNALLDERWGDAVAMWMRATSQVVDVYPDDEIVTEETLDHDYASVEIRLSPIFDDQPNDQRSP